MRIKAVVLVTVLFVFLAASLSAWVRSSPIPNRLANNTVNVEKVVHEYRIVNLGEKSVYVPTDVGGTGQRAMIEVWALQVKNFSGTWTDLIWAWGMTDDVVPYLQALQRQKQAEVDALMFNQPGYTPHYQFQSF